MRQIWKACYCLPYGRLRWLSARDSLGIDFTKLSPARFVKPNTWTLDINALYDCVLSDGKFLDRVSIDIALSTLNKEVDAWRIVQGHDLVHVLSIGFARVLGSKEPGQSLVAAALRLATQRVDLEKTQLWADLRAWEKRNAPYQVLG